MLSSFSSLSPVKQAKLWKLEFLFIELGKQVTVVDTAKDHDTSLALAWVVMLSNDIADLAIEGSNETHDLLVMQQVQV